jgi:hypothetical protein
MIKSVRCKRLEKRKQERKIKDGEIKGRKIPSPWALSKEYNVLVLSPNEAR